MSRAETRIISNYLRVSYPGILQSMVIVNTYSEANATQCLVAGLKNTYEAIQHKPLVEAIVVDCQDLGIKKRQNTCSEKERQT